MLVIGSTALRHYYPDFNRDPSDLDVVVEDKHGLERKPGVEYHLNPVLLKLESSGYITPNMLLTLKLSHMFWDNNWEKHMWDIQFLLSKGHTYYLDVFNDLVEHWEQVLPKIRRSELATSKEDFFTNNVNEGVDEHDHLHTIINPVPMYTRLLKDNAEVELDENKWSAMTYEDKLEVVREETYVMAYERFYGKRSYHSGFLRQLKNNIVKHFPKYIAIFAIKNYIELERPKFNYYKTIEDGLKRN